MKYFIIQQFYDYAFEFEGYLLKIANENKIKILDPLTFKVYQIQELKFDVILKWLLVSKMEDSNPFLSPKRSNVEYLLSEVFAL